MLPPAALAISFSPEAAGAAVVRCRSRGFADLARPERRGAATNALEMFDIPVEPDQERGIMPLAYPLQAPLQCISDDWFRQY
jgi:hypothetical protein